MSRTMPPGSASARVVPGPVGGTRYGRRKRRTASDGDDTGAPFHRSEGAGGTLAANRAGPPGQLDRGVDDGRGHLGASLLEVVVGAGHDRDGDVGQVLGAGPDLRLVAQL